jgi:hypothetical protein
MAQAPNIDGVLLQWGDQLFYPGNRIVRVRPPPKLRGQTVQQRAATIRQRIEATGVRWAPQVMVKVTGGGRGMMAIAAHFRYISKNGRLDIEDERGETLQGKETLYELAEDWRLGGTLIDDIAEPGQQREAFNIMLSMPRGTDPLTVHWAAREFAKVELADHKYVMVLHDHQANPHVHISVRAESKHGKRLNPRKADLHHWRETFAEKLRDRGVEAEATRLATRGSNRNYDPLWRIKAREDGRLRTIRPSAKSSDRRPSTRLQAIEAWSEVGRALATSSDRADRELARQVTEFIQQMVPIGPSGKPNRQQKVGPSWRSIDFPLRQKPRVSTVPETAHGPGTGRT